MRSAGCIDLALASLLPTWIGDSAGISLPQDVFAKPGIDAGGSIAAEFKAAS